MRRQHPIAFLRYTSRYFWLLLIPFVRGLMSLRGDLNRWLRGSYIDIMVLSVIIAIAIFRWKNVKFELTDSGIKFQYGCFIRRDFYLPYDRTSVITGVQKFLLRPFGAVSVCIDTDTGNADKTVSRSDRRLLLKLKDYKDLCNKLTVIDNENKYIYRVPKLKLLSFSLVLSSTLSGMIYFVTLLVQGGKIVDARLEEKLVQAAENAIEFAEKVSIGIDGYVRWTIMISATAWLISFMINYLRHINFKIKRQGKRLVIESGFFSKRSCCLNSEKINYADLRQNLLMKIFRVMSVQISCSGYGRAKGEVPVIVPAEKIKNAERLLEKILPEMQLCEIMLEPKRSSIMRYSAVPAAMIFGIMIAAFMMVMVLPDWHKLIFFAAVMGEILTAHLYIVNLAAFCTSGAGFGENMLAIKYCRFFQFHHVMIPAEKITASEIRQNFFQKRRGSCDLIVYTWNSGLKKHRLKGTDINETENFVRTYLKEREI